MVRRLAGALTVLAVLSVLALGALSALAAQTTEPPPDPTVAPVPTEVPTDVPMPTELPTEVPIPTEVPTEIPTAVPTEAPPPTVAPTDVPLPTDAPPPPALPTDPASCWVPFAEDFESGSLGTWTVNTGLVAQQADVANGAWAAEAQSPAGTTFARHDALCAQTALYAQVAFKVESKDASTITLLEFRTPGGSIGGVIITPDNSLGVRNDATGATIPSQVAVALGAWHVLEVHVDVPGQAVTVWYDGSQVGDLTLGGQFLGAEPIGVLQLGEDAPSGPFTARFDDVCVDLVPCPAITVPQPIPTEAPTATLAPTEAPTATATLEPTPEMALALADCGVPFLDGFESGDLGNWSSNNGLTVQQADVAIGAWAAQAQSTAGSAYARDTLPCAQDMLYYHVAFKIESKGSQTVNLLKFRSGNSSVGGVYVSGTNRLGWRSDAGGFSVNSTTTVSTGTWHTIQAQFDVAGQAVSIWYDGAPVATLTRTGQNLGTNPIDVVQLGENGTSGSFTMRFDDVCVDIVPCSEAPVVTPTATSAPSPTPTATTVAACLPFLDGFESGDLSAWSSNSGLTVQQTDVLAGAWAARAQSTVGSAYARDTLPCTQDALYYRVAFKIEGKGSQTVNLMKFRATNGSIGGLYVSGTNRLGWRSDAGGFSVNSTTTVTTGTWHTVQVRFDITGQAVSVWYDGVNVGDLTRTGQNLGTNPIGVVQLGENGTSGTFDIRFDDVCVDVAPCSEAPLITPTATSTPSPTPSPTPTDPATCWVPFHDGFESGNLNAWTTNSGLTVQQADKATGAWAAQGQATAGSAYARKTLPCEKDALYYQVSFKIVSKSNTTLNLLKFRTPTGSIGGVQVSSTNKLGYRNDVGSYSVTSGTAVSTNAWHTLQARFDITNQSVSVWLDGAPITDLTLSAQDFGVNPIGVIQLGENGTSNTFTIRFDNVCVDVAPCSATPGVTPTPSPTPSPTPTPRPSTGETVTIMAAGDIACGDTSGGAACKEQQTSQLLVNGNPDAVLVLGDVQYECGETYDWNDHYDPTWGRVKDITYPAIGNHEYSTATTNDNCISYETGAPGYWTYYGDRATPLQPGCRVNCGGYYSYDLGDWHIIALNSNCGRAGGCSPSSPQGQWLLNDLATHPAVCTLAYFHHPRFSSGDIGDNTTMDYFWQPLYASGVDVILVGHDHNYERFAPQTPNAVRDDQFGIREFVVGTGGRNTSRMGALKANSEVFDRSSFGVLQMTLRPDGYDWQFLPIPGNSFTDSGSTNCHGAPGSAHQTGEGAARHKDLSSYWTAVLPSGIRVRSRFVERWIVG